MQGIICIFTGAEKRKEYKMEGKENATDGKCKEWIKCIIHGDENKYCTTNDLIRYTQIQ